MYLAQVLRRIRKLEPGGVELLPCATGALPIMFVVQRSVDAAATIAAFNAYTRMADATGIPLETPKAEATVELRQELGLEALNKG